MLFEGGKALRHEPHVVEMATSGVLRVMAAIGMIEPALPKAREPLVSWSSSWVRAPRSGCFVAAADLGERLEAHRVIGQIHMHGQGGGAARSLDVRTQNPGVLIGIQRLPLGHVGNPLIHVADVTRRSAAKRPVRSPVE